MRASSRLQALISVKAGWTNLPPAYAREEGREQRAVDRLL